MNVELSQLLVNTVFTILLALLGMLSQAIRQWFKRQAGESGLAIMEILARNSVNAIEQIYQHEDIHGEEKLNQAKILLLENLKSRKIKVSEEQLTLFLESAVKVMNDKMR